MSLASYTRYKDSGAEWLGEVPEHWLISRLGFESWVRARLGWKGLKAEEYVDDGYIFLSTPNIKSTCIDFENVDYISEDRYAESPEIMLREGDVLLAKDGSTLGTVNVVRFLPRPATVNSSIAVITPHSSMDGVFLHYLFQSSFIKNTIQRIKGGMGVPHLFQADLTKFRIPVPPLSEQLRISEFLGRETSKIDALVDEQQRLIELLKEKRQVVISQAVTKGLNPDTPMKDSGIEWLGLVPKHWKVTRVKRLSLTISKGTTPTTVGAEFTQSGVRFIKAENITENGVSSEPEFFISEQVHLLLNRSSLKENDVLVVIAGATTGKSAVLGFELLPANTNQAVAFVRVEEPSHSRFVNHWLSTDYIQRAVLIGSVQSAQPNLSMEDLGNLPIAVPPPNEVTEIVQYLESYAENWSRLMSAARRSISLLFERRAALISAAVTGKIDVRQPVAESVP